MVLSPSIHRQTKKRTITTQNSGIQQHLAPAELCINHNISTSELEMVQKKLFKR